MPWKPGQSGGGSRKGRRDKITQAFLNDLEEVWRTEGKDVLLRAAREKPAEFARMVASLLPRQLEIERPLSEMSDDELSDLIAIVRTTLQASAGAGSGGEMEGESEPAEKLSSVH